MKLALPSLLVALSFPVAIAEDLPKPWSSVAFKVLDAESAASVVIEGTESLTKLNLSVIGTSMDVPESEFEGIDHPVLDSAQLLFGEDWYGEWKEGEEPTPHFIITMSYGKKSEFGNHPTVEFLFHSGKFQERTTTVQKTETLWEVFQKRPGEESVATGTATRPAHRPPTSVEVPASGE